MGCHTWHYKKVDISLHQVKQDALYICQKQIDWNQKYVDDPTLDRTFLGDDIQNEPFEYSVKVFLRLKRFIEKDIFQSLKTLSRFYEWKIDEDVKKGIFLDGIYNYCKRNDSIYICTDDLPHDIFRIGGYPDDQLLSYEETIVFCKLKKVQLFRNKKRQLQDFWNKYPDGMIIFG